MCKPVCDKFTVERHQFSCIAIDVCSLLGKDIFIQVVKSVPDIEAFFFIPDGSVSQPLCFGMPLADGRIGITAFLPTAKIISCYAGRSIPFITLPRSGNSFIMKAFSRKCTVVISGSLFLH